MVRRLLILGGTAEARALAEAAAADPRLSVITSLAGRTQVPAALAGVVRVGGTDRLSPRPFLTRALAERENDYTAGVGRAIATALEKAARFGSGRP